MHFLVLFLYLKSWRVRSARIFLGKIRRSKRATTFVLAHTNNFFIYRDGWPLVVIILFFKINFWFNCLNPNHSSGKIFVACLRNPFPFFFFITSRYPCKSSLFSIVPDYPFKLWHYLFLPLLSYVFNNLISSNVLLVGCIINISNCLKLP